MITTGEREEGWYRDPAPANRGQPTNMRWWDGEKWTTQVRAASRRERDAWAGELAEENAARAAIAVADAGPTAVYVQPRDLTPDGQPIAGWWRRGVALFLDGIVMTIVGLVFSYRFILQMRDVVAEFLVQVQASSASGGVPPDPERVVEDMAGPAMGISLVMWVVSFVYTVAFLKGFGATPGKMLLGMEVRLREQPGPLPWRAVLLRWAVQNLSSALRLVPFGAAPGFLLWLLNYLWPLWDGKRQTLHDKAARTNVVRR